MTDHPTATDWRNRAEAAEQRCAEADAERAALRAHADALAGALETVDRHLSHGALGDWSIALSEIRKAAHSTLASYAAWPIDGGAK